MLFEATDPDQFKELIDPVGPADVVQKIGSGKFLAAANVGQFQDVGIFDAKLMAARVLSAPNPDMVGVTIPRRGYFEIASANQSGTYHSGTAHVLGYHSDFDIRLKNATELLVVNFFGSKLRTLAEQFTKKHHAINLNDDLAIDTRRAEGRNFLSLLTFLFQDITSPPGAKRSEIGQRELESALLTAFLDAVFPDEETEKIDDAPRWLSMAEEFIEDRVDQKVCLSDISTAIGVPVRTLTRAFSKNRGYSPIDFLHQVRLERARMDLVNADPQEETVTSIAIKYGINDLGRFAARYAHRYGEKPSETLRKGRR